MKGISGSQTKTRWKGSAPRGLVEEHDGRIVDQLQGDGQPFTLTAGETAGARLSTFQEAQSRQDLIHLMHRRRHVNIDTTALVTTSTFLLIAMIAKQ